MIKSLTQEQIKIVDIVKMYPDVLDDRRRFASLIADVIPSNKALQNALVSAYEENIMKEVACGENYHQAIYRCSNILEINTGLASHYVKQAVEIFVVLFGKEEWLIDEEDCSHENMDVCSIRQSQIRNRLCRDGNIEYIESNGKIFISNISCNNHDLAKKIVIIPEKIEGCEVAGILSGALNSLRYNRCKDIVIPKTVTLIGDINDGLYTSFEKPKGVCSKIKIHWAKCNYSKYDKKYEFYSVLADNMLDEIVICNTTDKLMFFLNSEEFMLINNYQDKNGYWKYPDNDMWLYKDSLVYYSGNDEALYIDCCEQVCNGAISCGLTKEIVFGKSVTIFETAMISNCNNLEKIVFESEIRCKFGEFAISNCKTLKEVCWPLIYNFEQISIYYNCPLLGNMVQYRRLLTYQSDEEVIIVPSEIEIINNHAFCSCSNALAVVIPANVEKIENDAFEGSLISYVIIEGKYTEWNAHSHSKKELYVYSIKDSNVMHSVSPFKTYPRLYMKNLTCIEQCITSTEYDTKEILDECKKHSDKCSDEEMIVKAYSWEKEIHYKD